MGSLLHYEVQVYTGFYGNQQALEENLQHYVHS